MILEAPTVAVELKRKPFTLGQYHQMIETGVLAEGDRVELINGEILEMAAIGSKHSSQVNRLNRVFSKRLITEGIDEEILISVQNPVELGPRSEPEPDVALLRGSEKRYELRHPQPSDVLLLIEVSDSTVEFDRDIKGPLYASSGIQEYWLINLQASRIERHRQPSATGYGLVEILRGGEAISSQAIPQISFTVDELLG